MADNGIDDPTLILILRFISKVALVVDQALGDVYEVLLELRYLQPEQINEPHRTELLHELGGVLDRSRYRDVSEICSRLHHLSQNYKTMIEPRLGTLAGTPEWSEVFWLIEEHEGRIIQIVHERIWGLIQALQNAEDRDVPRIRQEAGAAADELRNALSTLQKLRNRILGLSGKQGLLELLEADRRADAIALSDRR